MGLCGDKVGAANFALLIGVCEKPNKRTLATNFCNVFCNLCSKCINPMHGICGLQICVPCDYGQWQ